MKWFPIILLTGILTLLFFSCKKEDEKPPEPIKDIEGNNYKTVRIGLQIWMAENLKTTKYNDGTDIAFVKDSIIWRDLTTPGFCLYNKSDTAYKRTYGILYNGYSVNTGKLCPTGWHIPENEEWKKLNDNLADSISGGGKLKESGIIHWNTPNKGATNSSGFTALPAGIRYFEGSFTAIFCYTGFWSATGSGTEDLWYLSLYYGDARVNMSSISKKYGLSVRCIKD